MSDIYAEIEADHQKHRALMARIADTEGASDDRKAAWDAFYNDIKSHAAAEEETFYSKLMEKTWGQDAARHSVQEHAELDDLLDALNEMDMSSSGWLNKFNKLQHDYTHHMDEEEKDIFARAREVIDDAKAKTYASDFRNRKAQEQGLVDAKAEDQLED